MDAPCFGLPLGEGDFKDGSRVAYLLELAEKNKNVRMLVELKGDSLEPDGGWIGEFHKVFKRVGGQMVWHPGPKLTKQMTTLSGDLTPQLFYMGRQANILRERYGLLAVTIHLSPAVSKEPQPDAGLERYNSPIGPKEMLEHICSQVKPISQLNEIMGGILNIETVDITNFRGGTRLPTYLALQTGAWMDLSWLRHRTGVRITADSEHMLCAGNLLMRRRDMINVPKWSPLTVQIMTHGEDDSYPAEEELAKIAGYWLGPDTAPMTVKDIEIADHFEILDPHLYHFGGAVQAEIDGTIGTHLPYDEDNKKQMEILDLQLERIKNGRGIGGVIEVVGQLDSAKYDPWSPRIADDEEAKRYSLEVVLRRWGKISK